MADLGAIGISSSTYEWGDVLLLPAGTITWHQSSIRNKYDCYDAGDCVANLNFYNAKTISGRVTLNGVPVSRVIRVYHKSTGSLLAKTTSAGDGTYSVKVPSDNECTVIVYDDNLNAVSMDHVFPV